MDTGLAGLQLRRYIGTGEAAGLQTEPLLPALAITHTLLTAEETTACQDVQRISGVAPHLPGEVRAAGTCGVQGLPRRRALGAAGGTARGWASLMGTGIILL